ncbi:flavo protein [Piromyces finnis]|uniref:Flavo protein n=1 Tax=Piromyces finnis TaxID=1754191 RepID=A0A1Y1VN74_9FUNG|nr:flavo protein [Piromyces finnis]|eukprot:ORX60219.1 flavo protein [Piromyces finnis]
MQRVDSFARLQQLARTFSRSNFEDLGRLPHVLIAATGSVACVKIPQLIKSIFEYENNCVEIKLVATKSSLYFIDETKIDPRVELYVDEDEWTWQKITDPVLHIELRNWTDIMLIVPLDANTLAKISNGICDNLLTCIVRAWNFSEKNQKPLIACPAMNTQMWLHPFTNKQLTILKEELKFFIVNPIAKKLACGDIGI